MTATALVHLLLHLYYANVSGIRHQLIAFYMWQQPGLSRDVIARYVRSLIIGYPHAMHSCMAALHEHRHALAVRVCP